MTNPFHPSDTKTCIYVVQPQDFADFGPTSGGAVHQVLSTFALGREMECAARLFVLDMKAADEEGIGTELAIQHHAPAFLGETVVLTATFDALDGANLRCAVEARVGTRLVATGHTSQRIVSRARLAAHFAALQAAMAAPQLQNRNPNMAKDDKPAIINIKNRRASHEYTFLAKYDAGVMLQGTEIKSIREGNVNLTDGYCNFDHRGDLWIHSIRIAPYSLGTYNNHDAMRARKLLLNKRELKQLAGKSVDQGLTIIPLRLFVTDRGFAKIEIALAQGKKLFDKRNDLKEKAQKRDMERF